MSTDLVKKINFPVGATVNVIQDKKHFTGVVIASHDWHFTVRGEHYPISILKADVYTGAANVKIIKKEAKHALLI